MRLLLVVALLLSGCAAPAADLGDAPLSSATTSPPPVVVALIDSGSAPYYDLYQVEDDAFVRAAVPVEVTPIRVELPEDGEDPLDREQDRALWESTVPNVLYHFTGTRMLGISLDEGRDPRYHYVRDARFHGSATTYLAAREAPEAIIVSIQVGPAPCAPDTSCLFSPSITRGMEWAADQDWIDIISVSIGVPLNAPDVPGAHEEVARYLAASERAAASGKIIVNAAGNQPPPPHMGYFNGPPWVICVGGIDPATRGEHIVSAKTVDVVANFTDYAPMYGRGDMAWRSGTSFAAPIVAGTLAHAMHIIRANGGEDDPAKLRGALNASATYFDATEWDPTPPGREPLPDDVLNSASLPILVQPQMGWGYVDAGLAPEIARRVMEDDLAPPAEKQQAILFQAEWQRAREEYWARWPR